MAFFTDSENEPPPDRVTVPFSSLALMPTVPEVDDCRTLPFSDVVVVFPVVVLLAPTVPSLDRLTLGSSLTRGGMVSC